MIVAGQSQSAYFLEEANNVSETHTLSVLVDNEPACSPASSACSRAVATTSRA